MGHAAKAVLAVVFGVVLAGGVAVGGAVLVFDTTLSTESDGPEPPATADTTSARPTPAATPTPAPGRTPPSSPSTATASEPTDVSATPTIEVEFFCTRMNRLGSADVQVSSDTLQKVRERCDTARPGIERLLATGTSTPESTPCDESGIESCPWYENSGDDYVRDAVERDLGLDPTARDTDGDGMPDHVELYESRVTGELADPDPTQRDVYITIAYSASATDRLDGAQIRKFRRLWRQRLTPDENVRMHLTDKRREDWVTGVAGRDFGVDDISQRSGKYERTIVITQADGDTTGGAARPNGRGAWVDSNSDYDVVRIAVHESVHMVAGGWAPRCETTPGHVCGPYLMNALYQRTSLEVTNRTVAELRQDWTIR